MPAGMHPSVTGLIEIHAGVIWVAAVGMPRGMQPACPMAFFADVHARRHAAEN